MIDLSRCTWQTLDVSDQDRPEDSIIRVYSEAWPSQRVQWFGVEQYIVCPYYN